MNKRNQYLGQIPDKLTSGAIRMILEKYTDDEYRLDLTNLPITATKTDGCIMKIGTSSVPKVNDTADAKFIQIYTDSGATSGDSRLMYIRHYITGAGGGGEALRVFTTINANAATGHGAHISLGFLATAGASELSGLGAAVRGTLHIPNVASWAPSGTLCAGMFEIYSDGTASDPAGLTELSVLRLCNSGNATGLQDVDTDGFLFSVQGFTAASGVTNVLSSTSLAELPASSVGLRVKIGTGTYYIPAVIAAQWN